MDNFREKIDSDKPIVIKMEQVMGLFETQIISKSFIFMSMALLISAISTYFVTADVAREIMLNKGIYVSVLLHIGAVIGGKYAIHKKRHVLVAMFYVLYSSLVGINLASLFGGFANKVIISVFIIVALVFILTAIYGFITDANMSCLGTVLLMVVVSVLLTVFFNIYIIESGILDFVSSCIGVFVFLCMIVYDMYMVKERIKEANENDVLALALYGGFEIYMDLLNMVISILNMGMESKRRRRKERWNRFFGR